MPSICQNIDVSRHVLVYRYIHFWTNEVKYFETEGVHNKKVSTTSLIREYNRRFGRVLPPFADTWDIQHPGHVMQENRVVVEAT